jgi:hypothetical protein
MRFKIRFSPRPRPAAALLLLALVLTLVSTSCGDSDDREPSVQLTAPAATAPTGDPSRASAVQRTARGATLSGDRRQAARGAVTIDDTYGDLATAVRGGVAFTGVPVRDTIEKAAANENLSTVCNLMSEQAKRETIFYAKRSAGLPDVDWTCEKATGMLLRRSSQTGALKRATQAELLAVNAKGDRATATVRFGGAPGGR